jgi:hypothetical protein
MADIGKPNANHVEKVIGDLPPYFSNTLQRNKT